MGESPPKLDDLKVSVDDLDAAVTYLERLKQYVDDEITDQMTRIKMRMQGDSDNKSAVPNGTPFGGFESARIQWKSLTTSTGNMEASIKLLSQKLDALKKGTADIAKAYRDTEERNHAAGKEIERILDAAAPPPQAPGAYPVAPPSDPYSSTPPSNAA